VLGEPAVIPLFSRLDRVDRVDRADQQQFAFSDSISPESETQFSLNEKIITSDSNGVPSYPFTKSEYSVSVASFQVPEPEFLVSQPDLPYGYFDYEYYTPAENHTVSLYTKDALLTASQDLFDSVFEYDPSYLLHMGDLPSDQYSYDVTTVDGYLGNFTISGANSTNSTTVALQTLFDPIQPDLNPSNFTNADDIAYASKWIKKHTRRIDKPSNVVLPGYQYPLYEFQIRAEDEEYSIQAQQSSDSGAEFLIGSIDSDNVISSATVPNMMHYINLVIQSNVTMTTPDFPEIDDDLIPWYQADGVEPNDNSTLWFA
jgi:hypothetical protein